MALGAQLRTWSQVVCFFEVADHSKWTTVWDHFKKPDMESHPWWCDMCQWPKGSCYHGGAHPELASTGMFWWGGWGYEIVTATLAQGLPLFQDLARYQPDSWKSHRAFGYIVDGSRQRTVFFSCFCFTRASPASPLPYVMLKFQRKGYKLQVIRCVFLVLWSPTSHIKITWIYQSFDMNQIHF